MKQDRPSIDLAGCVVCTTGSTPSALNAKTGGYNRIGYSGEDMAVRDWFAAEMERDGLAVTRDA